MSRHYVVQSWQSASYTDLFEQALERGPYRQMDVAIAYATIGGVRALERVFISHPKGGWLESRKRWLVGIDWCRSDAAALRRLAALPSSRVRIANGDVVLSRPGCRPVTTYHPKLFMLHGIRKAAIVCGSGNLSANGMLRGCECGHLAILNSGGGSRQNVEFRYLRSWFDDAWRRATPCSVLIDRYASLAKRNVNMVVATDLDEDSQTPIRRGLSPLQIKELRAYDHFWIDAGALGANLGHGRPGNQLDMPRFCRVFFGAPALDLPPETEIDHVTLVWNGRRFAGCTLKFADNHMDKLNIPLAGERGPHFYSGKTLMFTRRNDGLFVFSVGEGAVAREWHLRSRSRRYKLAGNSKRRWGLF